MARKDEVADMASEGVAGNLLTALLAEVRLLPDIWPQLNESEQNGVIERLRKKVADSVRDAVRAIASEQRVTVSASLKKIVFGDHVEAVFSIAERDPARLDLAECRGQACLIVVTDAAAHMGGLDEVKGDPDQQNLPGVDGSGAQIVEQARRRSKKKPPADKGAQDPFN